MKRFSDQPEIDLRAQRRTGGSCHKRERDAKGAPLPGGTLHGNRSAKLLHQRPRDGEAESSTRAGAGTVGAVEALEEMWQVGRLNPDTRISYPQHGLPLFARKCNDDAALPFLLARR